MEFIYDYFERLVFLFEEENDVLDIKGKIKTPFSFISAKPYLNTLLKDLQVNVGYLTDSNTMFCIRLKDKSGKNYFYDFYVDSPLTSPATKLVFGINYGRNGTLNKLSDEELEDMTLKEILGNHDASVKISVPPEITDSFFSAILQYSLDFGLFSKRVSFRGHLEADEIPFTNLSAKYATGDINKDGIFKYLNELQEHITSVFYSINNNIIKVKNYSDLNDLIKKMRKEGVDIVLDEKKLGLLVKDPSLNTYFSKFNAFHQSINTTYGRGGSSLQGLGAIFLKQKIKKMINFFDELNQKIIFFKDQLDKIPSSKFDYRTFMEKLDKLRNAMFHRNRLYRLFINKFFRIDEFIGKTDIISDEDNIKNKQTILNNILKSLKNKKIQTTIKVYNINSKKFEDKDFTYNLYSEKLENKIKTYFDEISDDSIFSDEKIDKTVKIIKKEIDEYLLDNMISMEKGWVTFNIVS
jgi:hypothetical protein